MKKPKSVPGTSLRKVKLKVKIIRSLIRYNWYHDRVGEKFKITLQSPTYYYFVGKKGGLKHILISDCQVIK